MHRIKASELEWQDTGHGYFRKILMEAGNHAVIVLQGNNQD